MSMNQEPQKTSSTGDLTDGLGKAMIQRETKEQLLYLLKQQYPQGVTTFNTCPTCDNNPCRKSNYCQVCIETELIRRGIPKSLIEDIGLAYLQRSVAQAAIDSAELKILDYHP